MRIGCLKFIFIGMLYFVWPGQLHAEMLRLELGSPHIKTGEFELNPTPQRHGVKFFKEKAGKTNLQKQLFQKRKSPGAHSGWLIFAVVLLSILAFIFALYGAFALVVAVIISALGETSGSILGVVLLGLLFLLLGAGCLALITKIARKLRRLKHGGQPSAPPEEKLPKRPSSKNLKNQ